MTATSQATSKTRYCPECGMTIAADASQCWVCGQSTRWTGRRSPRVLGRGAYDQPARFQLDTLLLTITLVSALLALARVAPGPSLVALFVAGPAFFRTGQVISRRANPTRRRTWNKVTVFAQSGVIVSVVLLSGLGLFITVVAITFLGTLLVLKGLGLEPDRLMQLAFGAGAGLGIFVAMGAMLGVGYRIWWWGEDRDGL